VPTDRMRVRLYWHDGRVEELKGEIDATTSHIVRQTTTGERRFTFTEEFDEGFAIFWEDDETATE
jgi:hypothetical protein